MDLYLKKILQIVLDPSCHYRIYTAAAFMIRVAVSFSLWENKPKMAYSRDLPKMARQQCGIMD